MYDVIDQKKVRFKILLFFFYFPHLYIPRFDLKKRLFCGGNPGYEKNQVFFFVCVGNPEYMYTSIITDGGSEGLGSSSLKPANTCVASSSFILST